MGRRLILFAKQENGAGMNEKRRHGAGDGLTIDEISLTRLLRRYLRILALRDSRVQLETKPCLQKLVI